MNVLPHPSDVLVVREKELPILSLLIFLGKFVWLQCRFVESSKSRVQTSDVTTRWSSRFPEAYETMPLRVQFSPHPRALTSRSNAK